MVAWAGTAAVALSSGGRAAPTFAAAGVAVVASLAWELHRAALLRRVAAARAEREARQREAHEALVRYAGDLERRTAELGAAQRYFDLALQGSNDGVWEHDLRNGELFLSPGFRERLGLEPDGRAGELAWFEDHLHPDDLPLWRQAVRAHLEQRASYNMDLRMRVPSGEYRWFRARGSAEWDFTGRPIRMSGSLTDVTERRFAEARLRESEATFRTLSASSPVGILKADADGQCDYVNARWQEITGLDELEALGEGWLDAVHPADREGATAAWGVFCAGLGEFDEQYRVAGPEGDMRWVQTRARAVRDEQGRTRGYVVTFEDVTGARRAAEALAEARDKAMQAAQAKSEFLANMSHEIRTPLNGVIGMAELLAGSTLDEEQRDYVRTINTSAEALLAIINDILDFSKIEAGKMSIEQVPFELKLVYDDAAILLRARAKERGLDLVVNVAAGLPRRVVGDPTRIRQILINLVSNAIKFTDHGHIELGAAAADGGSVLRLYVRDTGIGIPADRLGAVFESFTQADGSTTRKYGGTGLGLTICRQLAKLMGGSIHVRSEVGTGSEFWIELPLVAAADAPEAADDAGRAAAATRPGSSADFAGLRLLLVEDNEVNRKVATRMFQKLGASAEVAVNGLEAVRRLETESYDVVFMDCQMPEMDGFEATRAVREREAMDGGHVRIVAMTANAMEGDRERCLDAGMDDYVSKPVKLEPLAEQLRIALVRRLDRAA